jgi:hypothetical protein
MKPRLSEMVAAAKLLRLERQRGWGEYFDGYCTCGHLHVPRRRANTSIRYAQTCAWEGIEACACRRLVPAWAASMGFFHLRSARPALRPRRAS